MKKMLKKLVYISILVSFFVIVGIFVNAGEGVTTIFNNSQSSEDLNFTGSENITRYLRLPKTVNISYAHMNLTGLQRLSSVKRNLCCNNTVTKAREIG